VRGIFSSGPTIERYQRWSPTSSLARSMASFTVIARV
jgi:hypothetical protein